MGMCVFELQVIFLMSLCFIVSLFLLQPFIYTPVLYNFNMSLFGGLFCFNLISFKYFWKCSFHYTSHHMWLMIAGTATRPTVVCWCCHRSRLSWTISVGRPGIPWVSGKCFSTVYDFINEIKLSSLDLFSWTLLYAKFEYKVTTLYLIDVLLYRCSMCKYLF